MFSTKQFLFFVIGLSLSVSLFAQENNKPRRFMGHTPDNVISDACRIYNIMDNKSKEDLTMPSTDIKMTGLNNAIDIYNTYIKYLNDCLYILNACHKTKVSIENERNIKNQYESMCIDDFFKKIEINEQAMNMFLGSNDNPYFKYLDDKKYSLSIFGSNPTETNITRANEYATHLNDVFLNVAQIFRLEEFINAHDRFFPKLKAKINAIYTNRYDIFKGYRDRYCDKQYISDNFQYIYFIDDVSKANSNASYPQGSVFLINDLYKRDNVSARERHQFFIENHESQANIQQSSVAQKVYDFMDDEWDVRFTYYEKFSTQNDCDYRPWLVIGSFLQFVSVNRYNCKDLFEIFPGQPGEFGFDWDCLRNDNLYPESFNSFLEKWINDKFAYDCKSRTGNLTGAAKTEALLDILKEQLNIVKPRLRYIKNHTTTPGVAEFIRHIINED